MCRRCVDSHHGVASTRTAISIDQSVTADTFSEHIVRTVHRLQP